MKKCEKCEKVTNKSIRYGNDKEVYFCSQHFNVDKKGKCCLCNEMPKKSGSLFRCNQEGEPEINHYVCEDKQCRHYMKVIIQEENKPKCKSCSKNYVSLKCCSKCKNVFYCTRECQVKDFPQHKLICVELIKK